MFVKVTSGQVDQYPYTVGDLRCDYPNTSFPKRLSDDTLAAYGMFPVEHDETPPYDPKTQRVAHSDEPVLKDNKWLITKTVVDLTEQQLAEVNTVKGMEARLQRTDLLSETDWWASSDLTMTAEQTAYRQALRDITSHANWPHLDEADWPTKP